MVRAITDDLTGHQIGRWKVIGKAPAELRRRTDSYARWWCVCECGIQKAVCGGTLKRGMSLSCGCLNSFDKRQRLQINCGAVTSLEFEKDGETHTMAYWAKRLHIHLSCLIARYEAGDRGERLLRPTPRQIKAAYRCPGPNGAVDLYQEIIKFEGVDYSIEELSELYDIPVEVIRLRKKRGWSDRQAITQPLSNVVPEDPREPVSPTTWVTNREREGGWINRSPSP